MPEDADFAVSGYGLLGAFDCLPHAEVLVVRGKDLDRFIAGIAEANEVLDDVEQPTLLHHAEQHCLEVRVLGVRVVAVDRLPRCIAVLVSCNCADTRLRHIAHDAEHVGNEHSRDVMHIVAQLKIRIRGVHLFARRALQLEDDERHAVHEGDDVGPLL